MHLNTSIFDNALEKLLSKLDKDIAWRKKELSSLKIEINSKMTSRQEYYYLVRGAIALIYAHWEGNIKSQFGAYVKFLNSLLKEKYIIIENYDDKILDLIFYPSIKAASQNTLEKRAKIIDKFKSLYLDKNIIQIEHKEVVITKSNLNYNVLLELCSRFGIEPIDNINEKFLDKLLEDRNNIAHGESKYNTNNDYLIELVNSSSEKIINFMETIKNNILLKTEGYRL